ncbi:NAD-dependent malic enzyme [Microbulbifer sp. THAF38]|uniref:NAD-dependent malic enzyme n=1 Tax=Microbulbifer sp. THAF38 TaxID=2587856 RepID=UPI001268256F|nr:NAD-dependent malic enzyme [Microbulbifer sp. THAF38]QFT56949.1 NAD-dependent malic enzyme [Microbulbifer sp. THAF38]
MDQRKVDATGIDLLHDPRTNKGTAFTEAERSKFGLNGLIPYALETIETQVERVMMQLSHKHSDIDRFVYLTGLLDTNETLFYRVVMSDPVRFLPIIYDPTIGEACTKFSHIMRRVRGVYLSIAQKGSIADSLSHWPDRDIRFICVTNGGRILGLGDIGANGMGIPIGKLQLYTAAGGVPPEHLLPLFLDAGTNNEQVLADPLYVGLRRKRPDTETLYRFVDEFVDTVQQRYPHCCLHFEDWTGSDAVHLLQRYRDKVCCYNDDIQGTAGIALAGMINALKIKQGSLKDEKIFFAGAGSAGIGLADLFVSELVNEGLSREEAQARIIMFDEKGLLVKSREDLFDFQRPYAHDQAPTSQLLEAIKTHKPTTLIGVSTVGQLFTQEVVETMAALNPRPIIFALSNPTEHAECSAEQAYSWSQGRAIYAAGVQFPKVTLHGKTYLPGQANNLYIFPAVAMAIYATRAKRVPDSLFIEAARGVAEQVDQDLLQQGCLFPPQAKILEIAQNTAARVSKKIFELGLSELECPKDLLVFIKEHTYKAEYFSYC